MKRRLFTQMLGAAFVAPMVPVSAAAVPVAVPAAPTLSISARYWAAYFKTPGGQSALRMAQAQHGMSLAQAKTLVMRTVATGGYAPATEAVQMAVPKAVKPALQRVFDHIEFDDMSQEIRKLTQDITCTCEVDGDSV